MSLSLQAWCDPYTGVYLMLSAWPFADWVRVNCVRTNRCAWPDLYRLAADQVFHSGANLTNHDGNGAFCAVVDWGTTGFRLWILDDKGEVVARRSSSEGLKVCRAAGFEKTLEANLQVLKAPSQLPVIVCGMAGSRSGWREVPYVTAPAALDEISLHATRLHSRERVVWILPGIAQRDPDTADVIRGEETQLLGAFYNTAASRRACLPGTHSKWVRVEEKHIVGFTTFLTGDLYAAINRCTILAEQADFSEPDDTVFRDHVRKAIMNPKQLTALLFSLRGRQLLGYVRQESAASAISGLLIGIEIAAASELGRKNEKISLIATGPLSSSYSIGLGEAGIDHEIIDADEAVVAGLFRAAQYLLTLPDNGSSQ